MESESIKSTIRMLGPIAWLAFAAGLQMLGALMFFRAPIDLLLILTGSFITFGIYLLNRFTDIEDSYNYPDQKLYFQKKSSLKMIPILLIGSSVIVLALTNRFVSWHMILIIGGVVYSVSIIPIVKNKSIGFIRLKDITFVKNLAVSIFWGITSFAIASCQKGAIMPNKSDLAVVIAAFCLTSLINTTSCDVRDIKGDRHAGTSTLATCFGKKNTALFLVFLCVIVSSIIGIFYYWGSIGLSAALLFFANIVWIFIVAAPLYFKTLKVSKTISEPLIDSHFVMNGISLIILGMLL
jgi:4-hydroxybenzoate polyprenyltransferase